tara:strand:- start:92963 stop:93508 length:546 start_codon:yes stop_codon:yes gene_type:complete
MKNLKTTLVAFMAVVISTSAFSSDPESKVVEKAREAVESSSSDWKVLAESAQKCFKKEQNIDQAMEWINKSIEINPDPSNYEIKGDYYKSVKQYRKALQQYYEGILVGKKQNFWYDSRHLQKKVWESKQAIENLDKLGAYYHSIGDNKRAIEAYYLAIVAKKDANFSADVSDLQKKISYLR